jgi:hypothetical protein
VTVTVAVPLTALLVIDVPVMVTVSALAGAV